MEFIAAKDVFKEYTQDTVIKTEALKEINLTVAKKDFICIAGPSGSGKTTLLQLIGALDKPTSGKIFYEGEDITVLPPGKLADFRLHRIGFVFQAYNLINTLTALENTEYVMLLQGVSNKERRKKAEDILKKVDLGDFLHRRVNRLSGGQQQRVAVCRAIAAGAQVILADEPTANLDSQTAANLIELMRQLNQEKGTTFIFSTHDKLVMERADKVFQLRDGRIV